MPNFKRSRMSSPLRLLARHPFTSDMVRDRIKQLRRQCMHCRSLLQRLHLLR